MKTQISRDSFDLAKRYSGVYLQQGRMIVDADLNELADIVKTRLAGALADAVGSGAPRVGALAIAKSGPTFVIQPGRVYADGVPARLDAAAPIALTDQADYRNPPALPTNNLRIYADVWERPVTALEDNTLQDAGLHGADTATRSKTMLQVKWCNAAINPLDRNGPNPRHGNALLTLKLRLITAGADPCDPCAAEVAIDERIGNYLFRVEVHDVFTDAGETHIVLKWSRDNGAEAYPSNAYPADFDQGAWVWEFFDSDSENLLGHHFPAGQKRRRGVIRDTFTRPDAPSPNAFVRQWDGFAEFNLNTGALVTGRDRGVNLSTGLADTAHAFVRINSGAGTIRINLELLELTFTYGGKSFVAGDYWQVAVREAIDKSGDVVLGRAGAEEPRGIQHHYVVLADVDGSGNVVAFTDACRRRMRFPRLTDLRAEDVGFTNSCSDVYGAAENVQQALDAVCNIGAEDVGYTVPTCGTAAAPSVRSLLASLPGFPDRDAVPKRPSVKDILDYLMCDLNAARLPYDGNLQSGRWADINEGGTPPLNVQQALDTLVANLDGSDISAALPACVDGTGSGSSTMQQLLGVAGGSQTVLEWLRRLYCDVRATHIPLDRSRLVCADLATDASVVSVQDALDKLCQTAGHGCEITVPVGELEKRLREFAASDVRDIALCLLPGTHVIGEPISVTGKRSIRITGAPVASQIRFLGAMNVVEASAIALEDLTLVLSGGAQLQLNGEDVSSVRCHYARSAGAPSTVPGVRIGAQVSRMRWHHNLMSDSWLRQRPPSVDFTDVELVGNARVAGAFRRLFEEPDVFIDAEVFNATLNEITDAVATMPAADRKRWAAVIEARTPPAGPVPGVNPRRTTTGKGASKASARSAAKKAKSTADTALAAPASGATGRVRIGVETGVSGVRGVPIVVDVSTLPVTGGSKVFTEAIAAASPTRDAIRDAVIGGVLEVIFDSGVNVALALSSHRTYATLTSNEIFGEVLLMNQLEVGPAGVDAATSVTSVSAGLELVRTGGGQLTIDNNRIDRLWTLVPPPADGQIATPIDGAAVCTLQGNRLMDINHAVVARKLAVQANHFESLVNNEQVPTAVFGRMLVNQATVVGNLSVRAAEAIPTFRLSSVNFLAQSNFFLVHKF
jgi:hypothetical protein